MERNVKVQNMSNAKLTLNFLNVSDRTVKMAGNGTAKISEDELTYLLNNSQAINLGKIKVLNENELSKEIDADDLKTPNCLTDTEIVDLLKKSQATVKKEIAEIDSLETIERILKSANELDKSVKLIAIIEERLEELRKII